MLDEAGRGSRWCGVKGGVWSNAWVNSEAGLGWETEPPRDETGHWRAGLEGQAQSTHVNGAAEQGAPFQGLEDDLVEVAGRLAQLIPLGDTACEVLKALRGAAT